MTFAEDASAENVFATGTMHDLGGKKVEVKPATPKGSGSLARPAGGAPSGRPGPGAGASGAGGRAMPPFGGPGGPGSAAMFGSPPGPYGGYGMYGYPPAGTHMHRAERSSNGRRGGKGVRLESWGLHARLAGAPG